MISHELILNLLKRADKSFPTTSLYLDLSTSKFTTRDAEILLKDMIKQKKQAVEERSMTREQRRSIAQDFEKLATYSTTELDRKGSKGVAVFSASGSGLWEVLPLPGPVRNVLIVDWDPYIRPLTMLLDQYKRYCTVLVDREGARVFAVSLGEIEDHSQILDEVPGQVKASGWGGYEERRIERHIEDHVRRHLRHVARVTYGFFEQKKFDRLIIGGHSDIVSEYEAQLHSYLRERIVARVNVESSISLDEALKRTMDVDREIEERSDREMVKQLLENARPRGLGVLGLRGVLGALRRNQVHTLLIEMGYVEKGVVCDDCRFVGIEEEKCPLCGGSIREVTDVVEEAIRDTLRQNGKVVHVSSDSGLSEEGRIGATLRFKFSA
jgi:peptide subunit release factor 1 (eRF1)